MDRRVGRALEGLNFFMADIQAGIGPFLGVFLLAHGWKSGLIGTVKSEVKAGLLRSIRSGGRMFGRPECFSHAPMLFRCASLVSLGHQVMSGA